VVAIPLILKIVPPNRFYGFRTARTLSNRELWAARESLRGLGVADCRRGERHPPSFFCQSWRRVVPSSGS